MAESIRIESTGLVYRNPQPNIRSIVAYHPSLNVIEDQEFLVTFDMGEAVEAFDYHTEAARTQDGGNTWEVEGPLLPSPPENTTHSIRTCVSPDGALAGFGTLHNRKPGCGLLNPETFGYVPLDTFIVRSQDNGRTWTRPDYFDPPLTGPSWELCHHIVALDNGRWLIPTATWRGWHGEHPSGEQGVVFISDDQGKSWPRYGVTFDGRETGLTHFEQSLVQLPSGRLVATAWVYDMEANKTHPNTYVVSDDRGETFSEPKESGLNGQTCKILALRDGRIFAAYRRVDEPGLWGALVKFEGDEWVTLEQAPLWQGATAGMEGKGRGAEELSALKFGYPSMKQLGDDEIFLVFWCQEDCVTNVRWLRIAI